MGWSAISVEYGSDSDSPSYGSTWEASDCLRWWNPLKPGVVTCDNGTELFPIPEFTTSQDWSKSVIGQSSVSGIKWGGGVHKSDKGGEELEAQLEAVSFNELPSECIVRRW